MAKEIETTVTLLELTTELYGPIVAVPRGQIAILKAVDIPVHFFRYLYTQIGEKYHWVDRNRMSDEDLKSLLHDGAHDVYVLYLNGCPAGFSEIEWKKQDIVSINFFGIMPDQIGNGLGPYLLQQILKIAWERAPRRIIIETCTLDHPSALPLYQRHGFQPYAQEIRSVTIEDSNLMSQNTP